MKVTKLFAAAALACATAMPTFALAQDPNPMPPAREGSLDDTAKAAAPATPPNGLPTGTHFTSLDYTSTGGFVGGNFLHVEIKIDGAGNLLYKRAGQPDVTGQVTPADLRRLQVVWRAAHLGIGDTQVPGMIPDLPITTLKYGFCGNAFHMCSFGSVSGQRTSPGEARMIAAMQSVANRVASKPAAAAFSKVSLTTQGSFPVFSSTITIDSTGKVVYNPRNNRPEIDGQATPAELDALKRAFTHADVKSLPKSVSTRFVPDGSTFDLKSTVGADSYESSGWYNSISDTLAGRVQPLLAAIQAIQNRLDRPAPTTTTGLTGGVTSTGSP
jgi:hypothetical protein